VISAGDHFYPRGLKNLEESSKINDLLKDYGQSDIPWFPIVGNHDCRGSVEAQVKISRSFRIFRSIFLIYNRNGKCHPLIIASYNQQKQRVKIFNQRLNDQLFDYFSWKLVH
jgi:hypothetical protein